MLVNVYRDFLAIRFIRCVTRIPGTDVYAGGAGVTVASAIQKCLSEAVEREYELKQLRPAGIFPVSIAAHPCHEQAAKNARHEAIERLLCKLIANKDELNCLLKFRIGEFQLAISRTETGFFCLMKGKYKDRLVAATSAHTNLLKVVLKTWEEFRSIHFFRPTNEDLNRFTKINQLYCNKPISRLQLIWKPLFRYDMDTYNLIQTIVRKLDRHIIYLTENAKESRA